MAGHLILDQFVGVRVPEGQPETQKSADFTALFLLIGLRVTKFSVICISGPSYYFRKEVFPSQLNLWDSRLQSNKGLSSPKVLSVKLCVCLNHHAPPLYVT